MNIRNKTKNQLQHLLGKMSNFTGVNVSYLMQGSFWLLTTQGVASVSGFLITVILANLLPKDAYGQYRFVLAVIPFLMIFTLPGIENALTRSVARKNFVNLSKILQTKIKWGTIGSLISIIMAFYYFFTGNNLFGYIFIVASIFIPFYKSFSVYAAYYKGKEDFRKSTIYESISIIIQSFLTIIIGILTKDIFLLIITFFASRLITNLFFYLLMTKHRSYKKEIVELFDDSNDIILYGKKLSLVGVLGILTSNIDKLLIWYFMNDEAVAIFHVALAIPAGIVLLLNVIPKVVFPRFSRNRWRRIDKNRILKKMFLFFLLLLIPTLLYIFLAPSIITLLFEGYDAAIALTVILSSLIVILPLNALLLQVFRATKSLKTITALRLVFLSIFIPLFLVLYLKIGLTAAAISFASSEFLVLIISLMLFLKVKEEPPATE